MLEFSVVGVVMEEFWRNYIKIDPEEWVDCGEGEQLWVEQYC